MVELLVQVMGCKHASHIIIIFVKAYDVISEDVSHFKAHTKVHTVGYVQYT